jgi:hypothetical protein
MKIQWKASAVRDQTYAKILKRVHSKGYDGEYKKSINMVVADILEEWAKNERFDR